ncbi:unnamed protein product [Zymoseptoria tritici ST99CH_3D7]|uniref:Uncharacterized protein n=1 Tax=Zymoseptoria tritici (strain ST99CH_3D7) TaxID=1276538 RepID=A0A1X7RJY0_ZYMT9|nr:unnamed protein product [Zymoseptoria tritici ST99CH_3D7]
MCISVFSTAHPEYPFIIISNRDEFITRPTKRADWWDSPNGHVLAGRDLKRVEKGTWLGITRQGRFAVLTNFREEGVDENGAKSRGGMINSYLTVPPGSEETDDEFVQRLLNDVGIHDVGGFTLLFGELRAPRSAGRSDSESLNDPSQSHTPELPGLAIVSNRTESPNELRRIGTHLGETHGLSNSHYGDNSWPKVVNGERLLKEAITKNTSTNQSQNEFIASLFEILCVDDIPRRTSDESWDEYVRHMRNSIMIPAGKGAVAEKGLNTNSASGQSDAPLLRSNDAYGTMKQTVILVQMTGKVVFVERTLYDDDGLPLKVEKQEERMEFEIEGWAASSISDVVLERDFQLSPSYPCHKRLETAINGTFPAHANAMLQKHLFHR